jgi:hypothetical protein
MVGKIGFDLRLRYVVAQVSQGNLPDFWPLLIPYRYQLFPPS